MDGAEKVRRRALRLFLVSVLLSIPVTVCTVWLAARGWDSFAPGIGAPLVPVLYFLTELMTGVRFYELSRRWDGLRGWQRGVFGTGFAVIGG